MGRYVIPLWYPILIVSRGRRCRDRMVVGLTTTYAISAYHQMLWVQILIRAKCTTLCDKVCQWLATGQWLSPGSPLSSTNKTDRHDITEILLKVALNTIKQANKLIASQPVFVLTPQCCMVSGEVLKLIYKWYINWYHSISTHLVCFQSYLCHQSQIPTWPVIVDNQDVHGRQHNVQVTSHSYLSQLHPVRYTSSYLFNPHFTNYWPLRWYHTLQVKFDLLV